MKDCAQQWVVLDATTTSDRECVSVNECQDGTDRLSGLPCSCPSVGCSSCVTQDEYSGTVLVKKNEQARSTPLLVGGEQCHEIKPWDQFSNYTQAIYACRDACLSEASCVSFSVYHLDAPMNLRGKCCLKSQYVVAVVFDVSTWRLTLCLSF